MTQTQNTAILLEHALDHLRITDKNGDLIRIDGKYKEPDYGAAYTALKTIALGDSPEAGKAAWHLSQICLHASRGSQTKRAAIDAAHGGPVTDETSLEWAKHGDALGNANCSFHAGHYYYFGMGGNTPSDVDAYPYYLRAARQGHPVAALDAFRILTAFHPEIPHDPKTILELAQIVIAAPDNLQGGEDVVFEDLARYLDILAEKAKTGDRSLTYDFCTAVLTSGIFKANEKFLRWNDDPAAAPLTPDEIGPNAAAGASVENSALAPGQG